MLFATTVMVPVSHATLITNTSQYASGGTVTLTGFTGISATVPHNAALGSIATGSDYFEALTAEVVNVTLTVPCAKASALEDHAETENWYCKAVFSAMVTGLDGFNSEGVSISACFEERVTVSICGPADGFAAMFIDRLGLLALP
jgi:hypothetical protein